MLNVGNVEEVADSFNTESPKFRDPWPFRIKMNSDHLRWDSLKISAVKEFEEFISGQMNDDSHKALEAWIPVNVSIYDVDTGETYDAKMVKKESFWFDPMPCLDERCGREKKAMEMEAFVYSIEPFRHIVRRRDLKYGQEIGLRLSPNNHVAEGLEFSVLYPPFLDIHCFRF